MSPHEFIRKWKPVALSERATAQEHFLDLCAVFGVDTPARADPLGEFFTFEKGVTKTGGGDGFADVWWRGKFAWEYKKKRSNLDLALAQLVRYAAALENPPLHVVCDTGRFEIHTAWTNTVAAVHRLSLDDLADPAKFVLLRNVFHDPEALKPTRTRAALTEEAARKFISLATRLQGRAGVAEVAHFVNQLVFLFFAEDVKLLDDNLVERNGKRGLFRLTLEKMAARNRRAKEMLDELFAAVSTSEGRFGTEFVPWIDGGLFDGRAALPLDLGDIDLLRAAGSMNWAEIDPTIFGTLFERFLDPVKIHQVGRHYTDPEKIMRIVDPVVARPLRREWQATRAEIAGLLDGSVALPKGVRNSDANRRIVAEEARERFISRLASVTILDPACGSGNFLYLALQAVKDIELVANLECEAMGLVRRQPAVGPEILHGIEIDPGAVELARTTIWIGDIQWERRNAIHVRQEPILRPLATIEQQDALIDKGEPEGPPQEWREQAWDAAEFIVGNPPFLGGKRLRRELGDAYVERLFELYEGRVPAEADLVTYWFEKARAAVKSGNAKRVGLVATNSIRGGANRKVLEAIAADAEIFDAWADEPWVLDGAAVRVSIVCFGERMEGEELRLDGKEVAAIGSDLGAHTTDLTVATALPQNVGVAFQGIVKVGPFDVQGRHAREWLRLPINPNNRPNSDVIKPWINGSDIVRSASDKWIVDFGEMN